MARGWLDKWMRKSEVNIAETIEVLNTPQGVCHESQRENEERREN
jgi:hypothetical protein